MQSTLETLGLTDTNDGVFDGEWRGGGAKIDKISPIDGCRLASVRTASEIHLTPAGDGLVCEACRLMYPIRDDIPIMLIDEAIKLG